MNKRDLFRQVLFIIYLLEYYELRKPIILYNKSMSIDLNLEKIT